MYLILAHVCMFVGLVLPTKLQEKAILPMVMGANVLAIAPGRISGRTTALCLGALAGTRTQKS